MRYFLIILLFCSLLHAEKSLLGHVKKAFQNQVIEDLSKTKDCLIELDSTQKDSTKPEATLIQIPLAQVSSILDKMTLETPRILDLVLQFLGFVPSYNSTMETWRKQSEPIEPQLREIHNKVYAMLQIKQAIEPKMRIPLLSMPWEIFLQYIGHSRLDARSHRVLANMQLTREFIEKQNDVGFRIYAFFYTLRCYQANAMPRFQNLYHSLNKSIQPPGEPDLRSWQKFIETWLCLSQFAESIQKKSTELKLECGTYLYKTIQPGMDIPGISRFAHAILETSRWEPENSKDIPLRFYLQYKWPLFKILQKEIVFALRPEQGQALHARNWPVYAPVWGLVTHTFPMISPFQPQAGADESLRCYLSADEPGQLIQTVAWQDVMGDDISPALFCQLVSPIISQNLWNDLFLLQHEISNQGQLKIAKMGYLGYVHLARKWQ